MKMKVINLEDNVLKHHAISRALDNMRITDIAWTKNVDDGIGLIEDAARNGNPFELAITDMQYYLHSDDDKIDVDAGSKFIDMISKRNINLPIIMCSSDNLQIDGILGSVWYVESRNWENDLNKLVKSLAINN
jgi:LEA14-like dessication related protein